MQIRQTTFNGRRQTILKQLAELEIKLLQELQQKVPKQFKSKIQSIMSEPNSSENKKLLQNILGQLNDVANLSDWVTQFHNFLAIKRSIVLTLSDEHFINTVDKNQRAMDQIESKVRESARTINLAKENNQKSLEELKKTMGLTLQSLQLSSNIELHEQAQKLNEKNRRTQCFIK